jgi:hypothetical protein
MTLKLEHAGLLSSAKMTPSELALGKVTGSYVCVGAMPLRKRQRSARKSELSCSITLFASLATVSYVKLHF